MVECHRLSDALDESSNGLPSDGPLLKLIN